MSRSCQRTTFSSPTVGGRAHDAREAADPLGDLRVALVRHRGGALHAFRERLLDLANLGSREMADLGREPLERRRGQREDGQQLGVAVARDHLRRERIRLQAEPLACDPFHLGIEAGVAPDGAGELADAVRLERAHEPLPVAVELEGPACELPAERRRLGVNPVGAADADRAAVLLGLLHDRVDRAIQPGEDQLPGVLDLEREGRVDDVGGGEAVVDPAALGPELLGDGVDERGGVVVGDPLDLRDALDARRLRAGANRGDILGGDRSHLDPAVERGELDLEPACELALLRPDTAHLGPGVAGDHAASLEAPLAGTRRLSALAENPGRKYRGVLRVVDPDRRDRDAGRHLNDREKRVEPIEDAHRGAERDADHRQLRMSGDDTRERGRKTGSADQHPKPAVGRRLRVLGNRVGVAVRGSNLELPADLASVELVERRLHALAIGLGADQDPDDCLAHVGRS